MAILPQGATFQQMSVNPEDAQWIQARAFTVEEMARVIRIPPSKLHHLLKANFNTLEMQNLEYMTPGSLAATSYDDNFVTFMYTFHLLLLSLKALLVPARQSS